MRTRTLVPALLVLVLVVSPAPPEAAGPVDATIGVSGQWVVEIHDPDGTLVTRRTFRNALQDPAKILNILRGQLTPGPLEVAIGCTGTGCVSPCAPFATCRILEPRFGGPPGASLFRNLAVATVANGFQLRGFAVMLANATLSSFNANINTCPLTITPANCGPLVGAASSALPLTSKVLSPGIAVVTGQQVLVTITITFDTATVQPQNGTPLR